MDKGVTIDKLGVFSLEDRVVLFLLRNMPNRKPRRRYSQKLQRR